MSTTQAALPAEPVGLKPGLDALSLAVLAVGLAVLYGPTYWDLLYGYRAADSQGHEPLVLMASAWLIYRKRDEIAALDARPAAWATAIALTLGLLLYVFGRTQQLIRFELASQVFVVASMALYFKGWAALRKIWFPLAFLMFVVPLPFAITRAITLPLKEAVSAVTCWVLSGLGYPIGRAGVVITIGQYQLMVAEACAGLQTMFTLEALGLLYINLMAYKSSARSALMALLVVPVSFCANVVRVIMLVLITYYYGDEAGQGFIHGFAGLVLFAVALSFILATDKLVGAVLPAKWAE